MNVYIFNVDLVIIK